MQIAQRQSLVGLVGLVLASCAEKPPTLEPSQILAQLQAGRLELSCRDACLAEWQRVQPTAEQLDVGSRWYDLAALVVRTRYQDNLTLYYLGRAAQGLEYYSAAQSYYGQSMQLSGTSIACENMSKVCGGMTFPKAASFRLAEVDQALLPPKPRPARAPLTPPPVPSATSEGDTETYIEPPPLKR
jgi:hypothetical protein